MRLHSIEALCGPLDRPLLMSQAFAAAASASRKHLVSVGRHRLRGVREETELFTLADSNGADANGRGSEFTSRAVLVVVSEVWR
jgi:class 3 adenylate cyclase